MRNLLYIIPILMLLSSSCGKEDAVEADGPATIRLYSDNFSRTRVVDGDNLEVEQTINNITVLLTDPSSLAITHWYVNAGFSTVDDYRLVTIPDEASELQSKDIYVVVNYTETDLSTLSTITQLRTLTTPVVDKTNNLDPAKGFTMYGRTTGFDFTSGETAEVYAIRSCAKISVRVTFPEAPGLSSDNSFLIAKAASFTYLTDVGSGLVLTNDDYFNFAAELPLEDDGTETYRGIAYVYAATNPPVLYLYTHIDGSPVAQEYSANLPIPVRNHLYDIDARIYLDEISNTRSTSAPIYVLESTVTEYDGAGVKLGSYTVTAPMQ